MKVRKRENLTIFPFLLSTMTNSRNSKAALISSHSHALQRHVASLHVSPYVTLYPGSPPPHPPATSGPCLQPSTTDCPTLPPINTLVCLLQVSWPMIGAPHWVSRNISLLQRQLWQMKLIKGVTSDLVERVTCFVSRRSPPRRPRGVSSFWTTFICNPLRPPRNFGRARIIWRLLHSAD